jgi:hypothetical protein
LPFGAAISGGQCDGHEGQLPKQYPPVDDVTAMGGYFFHPAALLPQSDAGKPILSPIF